MPSLDFDLRNPPRHYEAKLHKLKQLVQKLVDLKVMTQAEADHENAWQYMLPGAHPQMFKGTGQLDTTKAAPSHKGSKEEEAAIEQKAKNEQP